MPRLTTATPKYRYHKASGQAVVTIQAKDHYLGPYGTKASKLEYDRLVGEWLAAGRPTAPVAPQHAITVGEVIIAFWRTIEVRYVKHGGPTGTANAYKLILSVVRQRYGHSAAAEFGPIALKAIRQALVDDGKSRLHINDDIRRVRRLFRWAASEQLIPATVPQSLETVEGLRKGETKAKEYRVIEPVADAVVDATLPYLSPIVADMVRLQRLTGARPGEVCIVRPDDIDRSGDVWKYVPSEHKTEHHGKQRIIFIGPKAQAILSPYLLRAANDYCFSPIESERRRLQDLHRLRVTPLSCGNIPGSNKKKRPARKAGQCYDVSSYRRAITRGCEEAFAMPAELRRIDKALPEAAKAKLRAKAAEWRRANCWSPHQLRHTAATEIRAKFGLEAVQVALGHAHLKTSEVYAEKNADLAMRVAKEVG